jgi:phosphatidylserine/phosphatidylglycerophosphate/cardiolipin synthase-like enzyme
MKKAIIYARWTLPAALLLLAGCLCDLALPSLELQAPIPTEIDQPALPGIGTDCESKGELIAAWFSDPANPDPSRRSGGSEQALVSAVDAAQGTLDVAMYNLTLRPLGAALQRAHGRGVRVRVVLESDNIDSEVVQGLRDAGIPILGDRREGLMHNKFAVIDGCEVWSGSANWSYGLLSDHNNLLRVRSAQVAANFTREFEEMFIYDLFGADVRADTPYPQTVVDGVPLEVHFSPDDGVESALLREVRAARETVDVLAYSFTSDPLTDALLLQALRGVRVRGVMDAENSERQATSGGDLATLKAAGLDFRLDTLDGLMHHKLLLLDGSTVVTGSYNFTRSADTRNDENIIILRLPQGGEYGALADQYEQEFEGIFSVSK